MTCNARRAWRRGKLSVGHERETGAKREGGTFEQKTILRRRRGKLGKLTAILHVEERIRELLMGESITGDARAGAARGLVDEPIHPQGGSTSGEVAFASPFSAAREKRN